MNTEFFYIGADGCGIQSNDDYYPKNVMPRKDRIKELENTVTELKKKLHILEKKVDNIYNIPEQTK